MEELLQHKDLIRAAEEVTLSGGGEDRKNELKHEFADELHLTFSQTLAQMQHIQSYTIHLLHSSQ